MLATVNFGFLQGHDDRLATLGAQAERYFRDDPSTAIVKLRQFAELLAKLIAAHHALYLGERETFEDTLRRLSYRADHPEGSRRRLPRPSQAGQHRRPRGEGQSCRRAVVTEVRPPARHLVPSHLWEAAGFQPGAIRPAA